MEKKKLNTSVIQENGGKVLNKIIANQCFIKKKKNKGAFIDK